MESVDQRAQIQIFDQDQCTLVCIHWDSFLECIIAEVCTTEKKVYAIEYNAGLLTYMDVLALLGFHNLEYTRMEITWTNEATAGIPYVQNQLVMQPFLFQANYYY